MVSRRSDPNSADSPFTIGAQTQWPAARGKKAGRAARSVSAASGLGTGRTESANPDETEDGMIYLFYMAFFLVMCLLRYLRSIPI